MTDTTIPPSSAAESTSSESCHPLLDEFRRTHEGHLPNAMKDSVSRRRRIAEESGMDSRLEWLWNAYGGHLAFVTLELSNIDELPLYSEQLAALAHGAVRRWLDYREIFGSWWIERGRNGRTHAHVITSGAADFESAYAKLIESEDDLPTIAEYACKPPDARANLPRLNEKRLWTRRELEEMWDDAAERYLEARAERVKAHPGGRLPKLSSNNLPGRRRTFGGVFIPLTPYPGTGRGSRRC